MPVEGVPVDFPQALVWKVRADGYMGGIAGDTLAAAAVSGAYKFDAQSADYSAADPETLEVVDGGLRKLLIPVAGRPANPFNIVDADFDYDLVVLGTTAAVDTTNTQYKRVQRNANLIDLPAMGCAIQQRYFNPSSGPGSTFQWITEVFPLVTISPARTAATQRQHSPTNFRITPFPSTKDITGEVFSQTLKMKTFKGKLDSYTLISNDPVHFAVYKTNTATPETFTLPFLPLSSVVTINATPNEIWRNGVVEAATSVNTSTGAVTIVAGAAGQIVVVIYTTDFVPSS